MTSAPCCVWGLNQHVGDELAQGGRTLREFKEVSERAFLVRKLREFGWNISKTAEEIDTPRSNLYKKLEQYNISQETGRVADPLRAL